ncbi:Hypothetical predicted protein, partial [Olea europaea subsp. europaea]
MTKKYNVVDSYVCKAKGYEKLKDCNCDNCEMAAKKKTLKKSSSSHFVLCENVVAANLNPADLPKKKTLLLGTLVVATKKVDNSKAGVIISDLEKKRDNCVGKTWVCPMLSLVLVCPQMLPYILPIPCKSRVSLLKDADLCKDIQGLKVDDQVFIIEKDNWNKAVITYIGPVPEIGEGKFFGLE